MARNTAAAVGTMEELIERKEIVITVGSGGVGKTTTSAALAAMVAVHTKARVLVVTVDPARRLADALGMKGFGNEATRVPAAAFKEAGCTPRGEMWAAMIDTKQSWDDLVRRHAPDAQTVQRILENPLYQNISGKFVQSHDYIAMERLYELHSEGRYDLIVVDTPPSRNAIDFIEAPQRMADFFSSKLLRLLIVPYRSRVVNLASRPFYQVADRILGSQFLSDIAEFFILLQTMYKGFVTRARAVERLLADQRTTFMVVATPEQGPASEAEFFLDTLRNRRFHIGALVLNRLMPGYLADQGTERVAEKVIASSAAYAASLAPDLDVSEAQLGRVLDEVGHNFVNMKLVATREAEVIRHLGRSADMTRTVPEFRNDVHDLGGLLTLGRALWQEESEEWPH